MKKLILIAFALVSILPTNGCRILKNRKLERSSSEVKLNTDVKVNTLKVDSVISSNKYYYDKSNTTVKETIAYKTAVDDSIELTGTFKIDTAKSLKGDTALTLKGNGVVLTITRNPHNNTLTANIKKGSRNQNVPFNEMLINRTITNNNDVVDTSKSLLDFKKLQRDSVDKSKKDSVGKSSKLDKSSDSKPTLGTFGIIIGVVVVICFFLWIGFRK